jgi:hypothetical protein
MPSSYDDFPGHRDMVAYLDAYASAYRLRERIRFRASVERLEPDPSGGWWLTLDNGSVCRYQALVLAIGLFWCPKVPGLSRNVRRGGDPLAPIPDSGSVHESPRAGGRSRTIGGGDRRRGFAGGGANLHIRSDRHPRTAAMKRFPGESPYSIRCDPHAYRRLLRADLRKARQLSILSPRETAARRDGTKEPVSRSGT